MQQFLSHRVDSVLYEINSQFELSDLSQSIDKLLNHLNLILNDGVKEKMAEEMRDIVFKYQDNTLQKFYLIAFFDGLRFESKMKEV